MNQENSRVLSRSSNLELLRIVAMLMVITHHIILSWSNTYYEMYVFRNAKPVCYLYNALVIYGVNLFVMISGYCGIHATLSKGVSLYLKCVLYGILGLGIYLLIPNSIFDWKMLKPYVFVFSENAAWWYIRYYIFLLALSPFINRLFEVLNNRDIYLLTLLLTVLSVYFGWLHGDEVNRNGYNLFNFMWLYCIGHCIRLVQSRLLSIRGIRWYALALWDVSVLLTAWSEYHHWTQVVFGYNSPFIVAGSVFLFVFFISFDFRSVWVNRIAATTLGVYLIQGHNEIGAISYAAKHVQSAWQIPLFALGVFAVCSAVAMLIDALTARGLRWAGDKTTKTTAIAIGILLAVANLIIMSVL